jgi:hypothetical protein
VTKTGNGRPNRDRNRTRFSPVSALEKDPPPCFGRRAGLGKHRRLAIHIHGASVFPLALLYKVPPGLCSFSPVE